MVSWTDNSTDETGFILDRATDAGFNAGLTTTTHAAGTTSVAVTGLAASTIYFFRVRATKTSAPDSANSVVASRATLVGSATATPSSLIPITITPPTGLANGGGGVTGRPPTKRTGKVNAANRRSAPSS
jgi:hypothetical protein